MSPFGVTFRQIRMVEVLRRAVSHADLLHHTPGSNVSRSCERHQSFEPQKLECMPHNCDCSFAREASAPVVSLEPPAYLYTGSEMRFESRYCQPEKADE